MSTQIIQGNALDLPLADNSVDLVVTSPPYFGLRSYQDGGEHYAGQLGSEATPAEFVDALLAATREMVRVVKPSGSIWVNLGDKYAGSDGSPGGASSSTLVGQARAHLAAGTGAKRRVATGAPTKSLIGIPWRYALRCIDDLGLILRAEVIWSKPNGLPESVTDRVRRSHEQWFHFTLQPRYFSAVDEVRETYSPNTAWKAPGRYSTVYGDETQVLNGGDASGLRTTANPLGKLPGSVWTIPTQPLTVPEHLGVDHFAAFPMELPRRIIRCWSPAGVCVACGEGRRPVTLTDPGRKEREAPAYGAGNHGTGGSTPGSRGPTATITGYTCDCPTETHGPAVGSSVPTCKCGRQFKTWRAQGIHETAERKKRGAVGAGEDGQHSEACRGYARLMMMTLPELHGHCGGAADCAWPARSVAPTRPAVVLDPFGGTGTTALVAHVNGRHGISVDMSADYCRLAQWRTTDPGQLASAMQVDKPPPVMDGQLDIFGEATA